MLAGKSLCIGFSILYIGSAFQKLTLRMINFIEICLRKLQQIENEITKLHVINKLIQ